MEKQSGEKGIWLFGDSARNAGASSASGKQRVDTKNAPSSRALRGPYGERHGSRRSLAAAIAVSALLLAGAVMMTVLLSDGGSIAAMSLGSSEAAKLTVNVLEGYDETPITGAKVVILETGKVYETDQNGSTETIEVPVVRDTRFDGIIPKPWGEVSLIVYKEGFLPYALFYLQVAGGETRKGVKILLFEDNSTGNPEPFSIIEGPNRAWVDELVKMYQPNDEGNAESAVQGSTPN